ncbi:hypothetical protein CGCA056_v007899 [Colletotrichum aenigma]|uniref:uncharacterized protein n=1 Tax=Colletotrichum aenigma TaxID=1215731 RepID=UPI0018733356|nr:uncharacterized protein CGCA056_v007899 [Colletotrichum aenigma]KAF5520413.1 hypothetical protein CGCA056_v007899 [Colletotrichum aenigma]
MRILVAKSSLGKRPALCFLALPNKIHTRNEATFLQQHSLVSLTHPRLPPRSPDRIGPIIKL